MAYNDEYDEEENLEETQQDSLLKSKAKGMAKDAGKQVARQTKELAKKAAKAMWKLLLKIIGTKVFIIFSVIMFSIILLVAICAFLKINDGSKDDGNKGNVPYLVSETISNSTIIKNEDGSYSVGFVMGEGDNKKNVSFDEAVDSILETLKENGDVLPQYLTVDEEKQKEFIKKFMQAEIATTYPKLGDSGLQGCIYIKRKGDDSNIANLQYISQEEFQKKVDGKNSDVKGYFTLDDQGNLQVAKEETIVTKEIENDKTISENTITNITISIADYKSALKKYTLTFDYLWALLVTTGDLDFMDSVSKLAIGSSVDVMLLDEKTVSVSTNVKEHDIIGRAKNKAYVDIIYADNETATRYFESEEYETGSSKYHYEQIITTTTITPNIQVTNAKTWLADYTNTYPENRNENSSGSNGGELKDTGEEKNYSDEQTSANNDNWYNDQVNSVAAGKKIKSINARWNNTTSYNINENFKEGSSSSTVKYEYGNPVSETKERTDKNSQEENFVTLLVKSQRALDSLIEEKEWLFEMLKGNENAEYMIDVTKYLLYKATGKDYGVTEINLEKLEILSSDANSIGKYSSNVMFEFIASWENGTVYQYIRGKDFYNSYLAKYITEDKKYYICYTDDGKTRNFGFGVCHSNDYGSTFWHVDEYNKQGVDITQYGQLGTKLEVEKVDNVKKAILQNNKDSIKSQTAGLDLSESQIDALVAVMYQYGNIGNFVEIYKKYGNTDELRSNFCTIAGEYPWTTGRGENNGRQEANWKLFHEGKYITPYGEITPSGGEVVNYALQFVGENHSRFTGYTTSDGITFPVTDWCAIFVSYCFDNCGLIPSKLPASYMSCSAGIQTLKNNNKYKEASSGYVPVAGDIIFFSWGHTGIVVSCDGTTVHTVEGNLGDSYLTSTVREMSYSTAYSEISGYGTTGER